MQIAPDRVPVLLKTISLRFKEQLLKGTVEFPDCLLFIDAFITLQSSMTVFPAAAIAWARAVLPQPGGPSTITGFCIRAGEVDDLKGDRVDYILRLSQSLAEIFD